MDLPELLSSPSMWSHGFPAIRVTQERPLERALIVRNSSRRGRNWRGTGSFSVELHITTLSAPPGGPRGPQSTCHALDRGASTLWIAYPLGLSCHANCTGGVAPFPAHSPELCDTGADTTTSPAVTAPHVHAHVNAHVHVQCTARWVAHTPCGAPTPAHRNASHRP